MKKIDIHHIARIEGHGNVEIQLDKGKIKNIELKTVEPTRFFESIVGGRHFNDLALIVSRICGICSPNHTISGLMAIEDALDIQISERTRMLRKLLIHGSFIQNHATHLYFLAAPDYMGLPSVLSLSEAQSGKDSETLRRALELKKLGNDLCAAVGGRPVHPVNAVVGGFTDEPDLMTFQVLTARLSAALKEAVQTVDFFAKVDVPNFNPQREKLALRAPNGYAVLSGRPKTKVSASGAGWSKPVNQYHNYIKEQACSEGNPAFFSLLEGGQGEASPFMVGALARVNINWDALMPAAAGAAKAAAKSTGLKKGADNPYLNNLCQAIEIVDALQRCVVLCEKLAASYSKPVSKRGGTIDPPKSIEVRAGRGYSASEAPRGTLYYSIGLDDKGHVTSGDVITPTAQNLACIEADLRLLAAQLEDLPQDQMILRIEQLIRAYDPCLSCAVH